MWKKIDQALEDDDLERANALNATLASKNQFFDDILQTFRGLRIHFGWYKYIGISFQDFKDTLLAGTTQSVAAQQGEPDERPRKPKVTFTEMLVYLWIL